MKKAVITGITGQDGAYLAELLLQKGYVFMVSSVVHLCSIRTGSTTSITTRMRPG